MYGSAEAEGRCRATFKLMGMLRSSLQSTAELLSLELGELEIEGDPAGSMLFEFSEEQSASSSLEM
jgi:hypothetical protein